MYLKLNQVVLVRNQPRPDDPAVFERKYRGERILTTDGAASKYASDAVTYGRLYFDTQGIPCIVPDQWSDDDALAARMFFGELDSWQS